ncbi:hypothetical protein ACLB2K_074214 [Fragaria x ananassa]
MQREYSILRNKHTAKLINSSLQCNCASTSLIVLITSIKMELGRWLIHACTISILLLLRINASLSLGHHHANVTARCVERERDALLAIKGDLVDEHNLLSSWGSGDCCGWERVHCDPHTGHVIQLHLGGLEMPDAQYFGGQYIFKKFGGQVSPKIIELQYLEYLDLSHNSFTATQIPALICSLSNLRHLDLHSNSLHGSKIPELIGNLTNLRYLDFSYIGFSGEIPIMPICSLSNLRHLDLSYNHLNGGNILELIGNLTNLRYLDLFWNSLGDKIPVPYHQLGNLTHLQYLNLGYTYYTHMQNLNWVPHLSSLKYLDLSRTNLSKVSDWLETINKLPDLKNLTLSGCDLPPPILSTLSHINSSNSLVSVDLSDNVVTSSIFKWLCNYNTTLSFLDLGSTQFSGLNPNAFANMTSLAYLVLSSNQLSGLNPDVFANMSSLEFLDLSSNQLSGLNPHVFANMSSLAHLDLSSNQLSGLNPHAFPNMRSLKTLYLYSNQLSGLNPNAFANMRSLKTLSLFSNQLSGLNPDVFANMSSLEFLDLYSNQLSGLNPDVFTNMSSLKFLVLSFNQLSGLNPHVFANMSSLEFLDLSSNQLSGLIPDAFANMRSLKTLYLYSNQLSGLNHHVFANMSSLEFLDLSSNQLSGLIPDAFANMSSLAYLDLLYNPLEGGIPTFIAQLCSLQHLSMSGCNLTGKLSESVPRWSTCPQNPIRSLYLSDNNLAGSFPDFTNFSSLESLDLSGNKLSGMVPDSIGKLSSLEELFVDENQLRWTIPEGIGELSRLQYLSLSGNLLSGRIPESIGKLLSLTKLDLSKNQLSGRIPDSVGQLSLLRALNLQENILSQRIPEQIGKMSSLESLDLSRNWLRERIPQSIGQLSSLRFINLSVNHLEGEISEIHFTKLSVLEFLDLSYNSRLEFNVTSDWIPPFQLSHLSLRFCKAGPNFPKWLQTQKGLFEIDMSFANISDVLPSWFWGVFGGTRTIDFSNNQIRGTLGSSKIVSFSGVEVRISSNRLDGLVPSFLSNASYLDLSDNKFSEMTSFLCSSKVKVSKFLDLSKNHIAGEVPDCWRQWANLQLLDLSFNAFSGKIPPSVGYIHGIKTLKLRSNKLVGALPSSLKNCTSLNVIDLGNNQLSSSVPDWIGASLPDLVILMLQFNQLSGSLPSQLCHLPHLQILDVSVNEISGTIPKCLNNLTSLAQEGNSNLTIRHSFNISEAEPPMTSLYYDDDATFMWKGTLASYKNTLGLVKRIDLSSNRLTGEIPSEITYLVGLVSLNLSNNSLSGQIPLDIGKLKSLDSLDLSINKIGGGIPTSLAHIDRLGAMNLSYNNLSGEIPTGTQPQGFTASSYIGNPWLCGPPLHVCDPEGTGRPNVSRGEDDADEFITQGFYISLGLGFAVGFWGVCGSLIFKRIGLIDNNLKPINIFWDNSMLLFNLLKYVFKYLSVWLFGLVPHSVYELSITTIDNWLLKSLDLLTNLQCSFWLQEQYPPSVLIVPRSPFRVQKGQQPVDKMQCAILGKLLKLALHRSELPEASHP